MPVAEDGGGARLVSPKLHGLVWPVLVLVPLDQLTKLWVASRIVHGSKTAVIDGFFWISHARNPGGALGLFQSVPVAVFIGLTLVALLLIWSFYRRVEADDRFSATALGLILAGAIGNLIDRVVRGEVVDFLKFNLGLFEFPDFNVADSAIVIGAGLLLLDLFASETEGAAEAPGEPEGEG